VRLRPDPAIFLETFPTVFSAVAMLCLIALAGFLGVRRGLLGDEAVGGLTRLLVDVVAPAKLVSALLAGLNGETMARSGVIMLGVLACVWFSFGASWLATRLWRGGDRRRDRAIWTLGAMNNGVYLPLPLMLAVTPPEQHDEATVLIAGAFVVLVAMQWTLGVFLLRGEAQAREAAGMTLRQSVLAPFNPPLIAIVASAVLVLTPVGAVARGEAESYWIGIGLRAAGTLGDALPPLALLVLGMMIGRCRLSEHLDWRAALVPAVVRLAIAPAAMLWAVKAGPFSWAPPLVLMTLMVEASAPPATNLSLIARRYGGDWQMVSASLMVGYLGAMVALPFWAAMALS